MVKKDGHIHTPFCPHGSKDSIEKYIERALSLGYTEISFTEHAPLPEGFIDTTPTQDSAMSWEDWEHYVEEVERVKQLYIGKIKINCGLEIDFIEGFEEETREALNKLGPKLDDAILSVHFIKQEERYDCLDYSPQNFEKMIAVYGSVEKIYQRYYNTVRLSVEADLGPYKPKRIGHITLVHKFQNRFPFHGNEKTAISPLLQEIKKAGYELDYNGAGTAKPLCREPYPPNWVIEEAMKLQIPLVYGSDAHQVKELGQGSEQLLVSF
ncbi:histidinol-phosphatase HisJ [Bacillus tuaregi]|uniref:histidinol-phosphatase HisJ n=1 Tax=Bacillus tuaregi TaxID=1816695 RepID=UPI0008F82E89|nr:histidinol-phosphatase HisJ [Bacillus tuaregi]